MAKKSSINKEKTAFVAKCITNTGWMGTARCVGFKTFLCTNTQPRYKQFCVLLDLRYFVMGKYKVDSMDPTLDFKYLDSLLRDMYKRWKSNELFTASELKLIRERGIGSGIRVALESKS